MIFKGILLNIIRMFTCEICQKQFETNNLLKIKSHGHFRSKRCARARVDLYEAREELYYCLKGEKHHYERYGVLPDTREEQEEAFYKAGEAYDKAYKFKRYVMNYNNWHHNSNWRAMHKQWGTWENYSETFKYKPRYPREKGIVY